MILQVDEKEKGIINNTVYVCECYLFTILLRHLRSHHERVIQIHT
jgi:hypothetical protein